MVAAYDCIDMLNAGGKLNRTTVYITNKVSSITVQSQEFPFTIN